jgi:ribosome-associated translation inhibitor RaiA
MPKFLKKNIGKIICGVLVVVLVNACSFNESKIKSIVDREIGSGLIVERARLELDKQLGRTDSKLKSSILEMVSSKIRIEYTEVLVEGRRARVHVRAEIPRLEDIGAIFSEARHMDRAKIVDMTADELVKEINKSSRKPASQNDLQTEFYEFYIDFEKNKEWVANSDQLRKAYSKKNLVTR